MLHRHRPKETSVQGFCGPINSAKIPNPKAHGHITEVDTCRCGAVRLTNRNGLNAERGQWHGGEQ